MWTRPGGSRTGKGYGQRQGEPWPPAPPPHSPLSLQGPQAASSLSTVPSWPPWSLVCSPMWSSSGRWSGHCPGVPPLPIWTPSQLAVSVKAGAGWQVPPAPHSWRSRKQRQQLAKARTAELGALSRDQLHGDSSVFRDSPAGLEPCVPSQGLPPELGCRLYLHLPRQQQEEVERLLEVSGELANGWRGLAGRLGYQAEAVETMARSPGPASALLRDWAVQEGSGATLRALADALAAMGREDVVRALGPPAEGCSVV
uniref:Uncharacterized protein n=1 Tax=Ovis aries TaxID=9940 RepID=A0AC11D885_SHEEP